jgi:hypothetical protein
MKYKRTFPFGSQGERGDCAGAPFLRDVDLLTKLAQRTGCELRVITALELAAESIKLGSYTCGVSSLEAEELQA